MAGPEPTNYTAGEAAKLAALVARAAFCVQRGRSTASVDAAMERVKADAVAREQAADRAVAAARQKKINAKADKRAARTWF